MSDQSGREATSGRRWEHTVVVKADIRSHLYLACACGWVSDSLWEPAVTRLAEVAQDHRRSVTPPARETTTDVAASASTYNETADPLHPSGRYQTFDERKP